MNKWIVGSMVVALSFGAAACSSDKAVSGSKQKDVVARTMNDATTAGVTADEACVTKVIAQLSDADMQLILASPAGSQVKLSDAGEAVGKQLASCISTDTTDTGAPADTVGS